MKTIPILVPLALMGALLAPVTVSAQTAAVPQSTAAADSTTSSQSQSPRHQRSADHQRKHRHHRHQRARQACMRAAKAEHLTGSSRAAKVKSCVAVHKACWRKAKAQHLAKGHARREFIKACIKE